MRHKRHKAKEKHERPTTVPETVAQRLGRTRKANINSEKNVHQHVFSPTSR